MAYLNKPNKLKDEEVEKILKDIKASFAMENSYITVEEEKIGRMLLKDEITDEEALNLLIKSN